VATTLDLPARRLRQEEQADTQDNRKRDLNRDGDPVRAGCRGTELSAATRGLLSTTSTHCRAVQLFLCWQEKRRVVPALCVNKRFRPKTLRCTHDGDRPLVA
jgi:hypothetical protein